MVLCDSGVKLAACVTVCHQHVVCMQINIGGGHQLETKASEPEAAAPTTAAAAAAHKPVGVQSASSADGSEPELQEMPNQSLPNKRRRVMDSQADMSEHDESEGNSVPTNQGAPSPAVLQSTAHTERPDDRQGSDNISSDVDDNDDDDDNDDLLVVKRRDVLSDSNAAAAAEGGIPLGGVELRGNKKRKKLRIDPGKTSGARTVFDEAGESLQPLALLAKEQLDRSAHLLHLSCAASLPMCRSLLPWPFQVNTCVQNFLLLRSLVAESRLQTALHFDCLANACDACA